MCRVIIGSTAQAPLLVRSCNQHGFNCYFFNFESMLDKFQQANFNTDNSSNHYNQLQREHSIFDYWNK